MLLPLQQIEMTRYYRDGGHWRKWAIATPFFQDSDAAKAKVGWQPVIEWRGHGGSYEKPLEDAWNFMPEIHDSGRPKFCPMPNTDEFRQAYREPLHRFVDACEQFYDAVECLSSLMSKKGPFDLSRIEQQHLNNLNRLAECVTTTFRIPLRRREMCETRSAAGLLACFALMFLLDIAENRKVGQCKKCDKWFVCSGQKALYCTDRCQAAAEKFRQREGYREKKSKMFLETWE